jgi:hypothetical protein
MAHKKVDELQTEEGNMAKRTALLLGGLALLIALALGGLWLWDQAARPVQAQTPTPVVAADHSPTQTITVVGQGSVRVEPDIANISIGVETMAETVSEAVAQNEVQMKAILAALEESGIPEKDIQTMNYSVYFERLAEPMPTDTSAESSQPKGQYRVSNMVNVTVRDLEKVSTVLDATIEAGANNIWGVSFSLDKLETAQADARSKAMADAQARAEALAELSGVNLGPVMSISEVLTGGGVPMMALAADRAAGGGGPISPGQVEVGYQIQVAYFIERE